MATEIKNQNLLLTEINFNKILFFFFLIFQALALIICFQYDLIYSLPIISIFLILLFFILGQNRLKILLIFTILLASILPRPTSRKLFFLRLEEIPFILLLFLTILAFERKERYHLKTKSDYLLLSFLLLTFFSLFYGILLGNPIFRAFDDFLILFYYAFYFLVLIYFQEEKWQKILVITIIVVSVLVSLEYVLPFLLTFQIKRYATDQQHLFNLGYPLLFSYILLGKKTKYKILAFLSLILMTLAVIISLTRALWFSIPFSLFIIFFIYLWKEKKKPMTKIFFILSVIFLYFLIFNFLFKKEGFQKFLAVRGISQRATRISRDLSLIERLLSAQYILKKFKQNPILGIGFGDVHPTVIPWKKKLEFSWMDCLFLNLLWKMGVTGLIIFLLIYCFFFKNIFKVIKLPKDNFQYWFSIGVLSSFVSLLLISITSGVLLIYRFNFVWASLLALFNLWSQQTS